MSKKLESVIELAQSNIMGTMLEVLANDLGVSIDSLDRLGIGWLPIVEFQNNKSYTGWWAIPEYDARGNLVGISLRSRDGIKVTYPGSKRGLVFSIDRDKRQALKYRPGSHNWVRTHEEKIECPICGKPDGCLLSKDDPEDPSAVICRVVEEGSRKQTGLGWLHVLKETSALDRNSSLAPGSDEPIIIVEGMTDCAAALSLGFEAVGRPSDRSGFAALANMVRGRDVIVIGENDRKADGRAPGFEGMKAAATAMQEHCPSVTKIMPPAKFKDLRTWYKEGGLTREHFLDYLKSHGDSSVENAILKDDNPTTAAEAFLNDCFKHGRHLTIIRWMKSCYHVYSEGRYVKVDAEAVENRLRKWSRGRHYLTQKPGSPDPVLMPVRQTKGWVSNVMAAIPAETSPGMFVDDLSPPMWLPGHSGPDPRLLIPFKNGVLDVVKWCSYKDDYLMPHTPELFNLHCLPYDFDPDAKTRHWLPFLQSSLDDEAAKIRLLQEWYAYCMTGMTDQQKFLILVGAKNSGKSVILSTLEALIGSENYGAGDPKQMTERFGFAGQVGKLVTGFDEITITRDVDSAKLSTILKQLSGEASVAVEEKGKDARRATLNARMMMTCNTLPYMRDTEDALFRRLMIIAFTRTAKNRDTSLKEKFRDEIQGIALWALRGLRRLYRQGEFTVPRSMEAELDRWSDATNPIKSFVNQCCVVREGQEVSESLVYSMFVQFLKARHREGKPTSCLRFTEALCRNSDNQIQLVRRRVPNKNQPVRIFQGLKLKSWVENEFIVDED